MDRIHKIYFLERKATRRIYMVQEEIDKKTNNINTRQCVSGYVETGVWCIETQREAKVGYLETKSSIMQGNFVVSSASNQMMKNSNVPWKIEADESMRIRLEGEPQRYHEDHIAAKGINSQVITIWHKFIPMPQALKIADAKAAVEKEWEKLEKIPAWQLTKLRNKKEVDDR